MCKIVESRRELDNNSIYLTEHSRERMHERFSWSKKTQNRMAVKAWDNGKKADDFAGSKKHYMLQKQTDNAGTECRMYGDMLFIFSDRALVTAYSVKKADYAYRYKHYIRSKENPRICV